MIWVGLRRKVAAASKVAARYLGDGSFTGMKGMEEI
jgi:hypothetical protein